MYKFSLSLELKLGPKHMSNGFKELFKLYLQQLQTGLNLQNTANITKSHMHKRNTCKADRTHISHINNLFMTKASRPEIHRFFRRGNDKFAKTNVCAIECK